MVSVAAATTSTRVDAWLYARLDGGAAHVPSCAGRRYPDDTAPQDVIYPYVHYTLLSGVEVLAVEGAPVMSDLVYLVEAIAKTGTWATVQGPSDEIHAALHQQRGSTPGADGLILSSICEEQIRRAELVEGTRYRYLGWRVRIHAEAA